MQPMKNVFRNCTILMATMGTREKNGLRMETHELDSHKGEAKLKLEF